MFLNIFFCFQIRFLICQKKGSRRHQYVSNGGIDMAWYSVIFSGAYDMFIRAPVFFYILTLLIKTFHTIEVKLKIPYYFLILPCVILMLIWDKTEYFLCDQFVYYGNACFFGMDKIDKDTCIFRKKLKTNETKFAKWFS